MTLVLWSYNRWEAQVFYGQKFGNTRLYIMLIKKIQDSSEHLNATYILSFIEVKQRKDVTRLVSSTDPSCFPEYLLRWISSEHTLGNMALTHIHPATQPNVVIIMGQVSLLFPELIHRLFWASEHPLCDNHWFPYWFVNLNILPFNLGGDRLEKDKRKCRGAAGLHLQTEPEGNYISEYYVNNTNCV